MGLRINTNVEAFNAHRQLVMTSHKMSSAMEKLSSGYRINRAADDAAGLAISERLTAQINGVAQAQRNVQDGVSLVQTAEGALNEVHSMLQRIRELAVQYQNGTLSSDDQAAIQSEVNQLGSEIERIGTSTAFNNINLLDGSASSIDFQVGANDGDTITVSTISLGSKVGSDVYALGDATDLDQIDDAIQSVSEQRATFGAVQNRLDHTMTNLASYQETLVASEMVQFTKFQILQQAGTAMLAQANQASTSVLSLLR
jgi:flagellin